MRTFFPQFDPDGRNDTDEHRGPRLREIPVRMVWPTLITILALCAGMTGVRQAFEGHFEVAVVMVLIAAFLDGIDGRLARALKATSMFGAQMDSLGDVVNFGVAPALVLYAYLLHLASPIGWIAALIFAIACALRLARFNVMLDHPDKSDWRNEYFVGIPAPAGAMLVMLPVYLGFLGVEHGRFSAYLATLYTLIVGFLLISRVPVFSGKSIGQQIRGDMVVPILLAAVLIVLLFMNFPWQTLSLVTIAYLAFLPVSARAYWQRKRREDQEGAGRSEPL